MSRMKHLTESTSSLTRLRTLIKSENDLILNKFWNFSISAYPHNNEKKKIRFRPSK